MPRIVGIRFKQVGKIYYFDPNGIELAVGDSVIVETARGIEMGKVVLPLRDVNESSIVSPLKPIIRKATQDDEQQSQVNRSMRDEALALTKSKIEKHGLVMKLIDAEYTFDRTKLIIYFTAEGRVDFRELVKDLASLFKIRIELRQIGIRDESKILGGLAPCGRGCCCNQHLGEFGHVSIKMAKTQGLSLNPSKISGLCGRLMCCLEYENDHYSQTYKTMPKIGSEVTTPDGQGTVISNNMLKLTVKVKTTDPDGSFGFAEYPLDQVKGRHTMADDDDDITVDAELKDILD